MKILFVLENLAQKCGANVNIAINITKKLNDDSVSVFTKTNEARGVDDQKRESFDECVSFHSDETEYLAAFQDKYAWNRCDKLKKIFLMLTHPKVPIYMLDTKYFDSSITRRRYVKQLNRLCKENDFDAVVGVCAPYYIARVIAKAKTGAKKAIIQLDPYSYNYTMPQRFINRRRGIEEKTAQKLDKIFAASFVYDDIQKNSILSQTDKLERFMLPGILVDDEGVVTEASAEEKKTVDLVFVGQFYDKIRNPRFLLELMCKLPENYVLHVFGGGADKTVGEYKASLGERLVCHGWVSAEAARREMYAADLLINLNNSIQNQMASKLFEYIGTGRPFLNICKTEECGSLGYTDKYPLCLDVIENEDDDHAAKIVDFVNRVKGQTVPREKILELFGECTDLYVAKLIRKELANSES